MMAGGSISTMSNLKSRHCGPQAALQGTILWSYGVH